MDSVVVGLSMSLNWSGKVVASIRKLLIDDLLSWGRMFPSCFSRSIHSLYNTIPHVSTGTACTRCINHWYTGTSESEFTCTASSIVVIQRSRAHIVSCTMYRYVGTLYVVTTGSLYYRTIYGLPWNSVGFFAFLTCDRFVHCAFPNWPPAGYGIRTYKYL